MIGAQWMKHSPRVKFKDAFSGPHTAGSDGGITLEDYYIYFLFHLPFRIFSNIFQLKHFLTLGDIEALQNMFRPQVMQNTLNSNYSLPQIPSKKFKTIFITRNHLIFNSKLLLLLFFDAEVDAVLDPIFRIF
jgi:hypothetical protein